MPPEQASDAKSRAASTINQFCTDNSISRTRLYALWKEGRGPRYFLNGTHRRITIVRAQRQDWAHREATQTEILVRDKP